MKLSRQFIFTILFIFIGCSQHPVSSTDPSSKEIIITEPHEPNPEAIEHFMDAQLYISQNNYAMAIIELQDALTLDPNAGAIHVSLADALWKIGKIERSEDHLLSAISLNNNDTDARIMLANQYIIRHQYKKAEDQFRKLSSIEPNNAEHLNALAELAAAQKQWGVAIQLFREAYEIDPSQIKSLEQAAEIALRSNQLQLARDVYAHLVEIDNQNINYLSAYADLVIMDEDYDKAIEIINSILDIEGITKDRLFQSGVIFYQKGQFEQSLSFFRKALMLNQDDIELLHFLTSAFIELDQSDSANIYSEKMIILAPDDYRGYINKSLNYLNDNNITDAIIVLENVAETFQTEYAIQYLLGNSYYLNQTYDKSIIYLNRALKISPKARNIMHMLAIIHDTEHNWTISDSMYQHLILTDSTDAQAFNNYAYSLVERNTQLENALSYASKAISIAPKNAAYLDTYGWIHFKLGHIEEAIDYIYNSVKMDNSNAIVLEHLGDVFLASGESEEARKYYRKAFEINPENEILKTKVLSK
ncbi:MAG: tetratricopeptide repeat protein [Fidelibacterota bacterium]